MALELDGRRKELCDWLTANGIDPHRVPFDADLTIDDTDSGRVIRVEVEVTGDDGRPVPDAREHRAAIENRTVPLVVEPPVWREPYEKPTRATLLAAVERVRALHRKANNGETCVCCAHGQRVGYDTTWPCDTIRALEGEQS